MNPQIGEKKSGIKKYAAGFLAGAALTSGIFYIGHQNSMEPLAAMEEYKGKQYLVVKDFIINKMDGLGQSSIRWSEKDNFYLFENGQLIPLSWVEKLEGIKVKAEQEARRKKLAEIANRYSK